MKKILTYLLCLTAVAACSGGGDGIAALKDGFQTPPLTARPGVYWYFMDGNFSKEGITKDLEAMSDAGIGYVIFLEVGVGIPRGPVDFMSEEWTELFRFAVSECERLDIQMILGIGPGWTGSGGPWVKGEQSMQHLVSSTAKVSGGGKVKVHLDVPAANPPFFGEGAFTPQMRKDWEEFYRDVAVLAFPTPEGTEQIEGTREKALYIRAPYSSQPGVKQYLLPEGVGADKAAESAVNPDEIIDLTALMTPEGDIEWDAPAGEWTVMRFSSRNNGAATRPAPLPGVGMECDKFDKEALRAHFSNFTDKLFAAVGGKSDCFGGIKYLHMDSWEMGAQNWTAAFREEFLKRRGYDPQPYYPVYSGVIVGDREISERFLFDVRLTAQELTIENHSLAVKEYAHKHGALLSIEPYDMNPTQDLELAVSADVPMAEFWANGFGFNTAFGAAEGSSAAHLIGCDVVPAEAFTSHLDAWRQYPGMLKDQTDWAFGAGISRLMFHTFQHQCLADTLRPGMTMGPYGVHWDRGQTWWPMSVGYHTYVARSQFLLQQGRTVADILYLNPESVPHVFRAPDSAYDGPQTTMPDRKGYNFDACPPSLLYKAKVKDGKVVFPSGASYEVVVLPEWPTATPQYLEKVYSLINDGATVVGTPPASAPGLSGYPACDAEVASWVARIWGDFTEPVRKVGKGSVIMREGESDNLYQPYGETASLLASMGVAPDFTSSPSCIRYTHRRTPDAEIYFLSNRTESAVSAECTFRVSGMVAEIWDPMSGGTYSVSSSDDGVCTTLELGLEGFQSCFVVFSKEGSGAPRPYSAHSSATVLCSVDGPWSVSFDPEWGRDEPLQMDALCDWTLCEDPLVKYYSGTARYRTVFNFEGEVPENCRLDLGDVSVMARVWLNGEDLGIVWVAPWTVDISGVLTQGSNELCIEVVNLWQNRMVGDLRGEAGKRRTYTTWNHYRAEDPLLKSGLTGPVRVLAYQ
ncbi:MAG: glycosyl hydrolase [Candidatus Cryptobacteroides sp.]